MAKAKIKTECDTSETGDLVCRRIREESNGDTSVLAHASRRVDGQCNEVVGRMGGDENELDKLNQFMDGKLKVTCKRNKDKAPQDY